MVGMISGLRNAGTSAYTKVAENPKKAAMFVALALIVAGAHKKGKLNTASLKEGFQSAARTLSSMSSKLKYTAGAAFTAGVGAIAYRTFGGKADKSTDGAAANTANTANTGDATDAANTAGAADKKDA